MLFFALPLLPNADAELLLEILDANRRLIRWQVKEIVGGQNTAVSIEDLEQETRCRLWKHIKALRSLCPEQRRAYALLTAKSVAITELTRRKRGEGWCYYSPDAGGIPDPGDPIGRECEWLDLSVSINRLPERDRDLLYFYYFLGERRKEICRKMGFAESDFYARLHRVRRKLKELLEGGTGHE